MKYFIILCMAIAISACSTQSEQETVTIFSGQIEGSETDTIRLFNDQSYFKLAVNNGKFRDTLDIEEGYYTLRIGRESSQLYFDQGYDLQLTINTEMFDESIQYSGKGSSENNALAKMYMVDENHMSSQSEFYSLSEMDFVESLKSLSAELNAVLDSSNAKASFIEEQQRSVDYSFNTYMLQYENGHKYFTSNDSFKVSEDFTGQIIPFEKYAEADFKRLSNYQGLNIMHFNTEMRERKREGLSDAEALKSVAADIQSEHVKNELINNYSRFLLEPNDELEELYQFLSQNISDTNYLNAYRKAYETNKTLLAGMPSPIFSNYENHAGGETSIEDLKGKYTYIDVWATWCGPCLREVPHLKKLESEYHDKNIHFVSISIDDLKDHDTWTNMVNEKELTGIQLFADNSWKSDFIQNYGINGIPRFILLDEMGNIIDANAPRPSNPDLIALFEEYEI